MKRLLWTLALLLAAGPARAEIAVLASGMTLKLASHHEEGGTMFLSLEGGGEVGLPAGEVRGFVPDEVLDEVAAAADPRHLRALAIEAARRHSLDPELVLAVVTIESAFRPEAVSPKGARGLMQLMPGTAASLGVEDPFDPAENLEGGSRHLRGLVDLYRGDLAKALAAYNAGEGTVARHGGIPPYRETRHYVKRVLKAYQKSR